MNQSICVNGVGGWGGGNTFKDNKWIKTDLLVCTCKYVYIHTFRHYKLQSYMYILDKNSRGVLQTKRNQIEEFRRWSGLSHFKSAYIQCTFLSIKCPLIWRPDDSLQYILTIFGTMEITNGNLTTFNLQHIHLTVSGNTKYYLMCYWR